MPVVRLEFECASYESVHEKVEEMFPCPKDHGSTRAQQEVARQRDLAHAALRHVVHRDHQAMSDCDGCKQVVEALKEARLIEGRE